jgi:preprotein translocase subunit YajC
MFSILLQASAGSSYMQFIPLIGIIVVFYFFMIRPQQKKAKDQKKFTEEVKRGDDVVTIAGIYGRVAEIEGDTISLEVERGGRIKMSKSAISMETTKSVFGKK